MEKGKVRWGVGVERVRSSGAGLGGSEKGASRGFENEA